MLEALSERYALFDFVPWGRPVDDDEGLWARRDHGARGLREFAGPPRARPVRTWAKSNTH
eukprot:431299-Prymnesium_polylepis.1